MTASDDALQVAALVEHRGRQYTVRCEPAAEREDCFTGWVLFAGDTRVVDLPMRDVLGAYTPREPHLTDTAISALDDLTAFMSDAGVVDWKQLAAAVAEGRRLNPVAQLILDANRKAENRRRQKLAREHERLTYSPGFSSGMALGQWAGWGAWESTPMGRRDQAGVRALAELDAEIARLVEFRERLAQAINTNDRTETAGE